MSKLGETPFPHAMTVMAVLYAARLKDHNG